MKAKNVERQDLAPIFQIVIAQVLSYNFNMVSLKNVSKIYPNGTTALQSVNMEVKSSELVFLAGPAGSGKSTIFKLMIKEESASSGQVFVNSEDVVNMKKWRVPHFRRGIGVIFHNCSVF